MVDLITGATIKPRPCFRKGFYGNVAWHVREESSTVRSHAEVSQAVERHVDVDVELRLLDLKDSRLNEMMSIER